MGGIESYHAFVKISVLVGCETWGGCVGPSRHRSGRRRGGGGGGSGGGRSGGSSIFARYCGDGRHVGESIEARMMYPKYEILMQYRTPNVERERMTHARTQYESYPESRIPIRSIVPSPTPYYRRAVRG